MEIRKVKSSNGLILIRAEEQCGEEDIRRIELESRAEPRPEFHEAMGGMISPAMNMIQAPGAWMAVATISGVSVTHEEERGMGAVVTILVPLECAPSPLVLNTPYLPSEDPNDSGGATLPRALREAVERVIDEAMRYLRGERAQADLFAERPVFEAAAKVTVPAVHVFHDEYGVVEDLEPHDEQPAATPELLADGPVRDRPPDEVAAEFDRLRAEALSKPIIKPARGRRAAKADA